MNMIFQVQTIWIWSSISMPFLSTSGCHAGSGARGGAGGRSPRVAGEGAAGSMFHLLAMKTAVFSMGMWDVDIFHLYFMDFQSPKFPLHDQDTQPFQVIYDFHGIWFRISWQCCNGLFDGPKKRDAKSGPTNEDMTASLPWCIYAYHDHDRYYVIRVQLCM